MYKNMCIRIIIVCEHESIFAEMLSQERDS